MDHPEWVRNPCDRNVIRLMFSGVRKFMFKYKITRGRNELYAVGYQTCVQVCQKFDESKNVRFSTYLYRALFNNLITHMKMEKKFQRLRLLPNMDLVDPKTECLSQVWNPDIDIQDVKQRDREIIERLFGIGRPKQSVKQIIDDIKITKQRIYQIRAEVFNMVTKSFEKQH